MSGVHRIYDFAAPCLPWSATAPLLLPPLSILLPLIVTLGFLHPDLAPLPITPLALASESGLAAPLSDYMRPCAGRLSDGRQAGARPASPRFL